MYRKRKKGFTLVELLVVIAIIAIISAVAVPVAINQIDKAKIATAESETQNAISAVQSAAAIIAQESSNYPDGLTGANMVTQLNKIFSDVKQLVSISIDDNGDNATSHITVRAREDVKKNGQAIVVETDYAMPVVEDMTLYSVDGAWSLNAPSQG